MVTLKACYNNQVVNFNTFTLFIVTNSLPIIQICFISFKIPYILFFLTKYIAYLAFADVPINY